LLRLSKEASTLRQALGRTEFIAFKRVNVPFFVMLSLSKYDKKMILLSFKEFSSCSFVCFVASGERAALFFSH
ncbi:hypothetical protein EFY79_21165, partial [Hanamia caeni]